MASRPAKAAASKKSPLPPVPEVRVVVGTDAFLRRAALSRLRQGFGDQDTHLETFDLSERPLAEVMAAVKSLPLLAQKQCIVANRLDAVPAADHSLLRDYLERPLKSTLLLLVADKLDARLQLVRELTARGCLDMLRPPPRASLASWLSARATELGVLLPPAVAAMLVSRVGDDLALLDESLRKVALLVGEGRHIGRNDVLALVAPTREASIFALTDALGAGLWHKTSAALAALLADGEQPLVILAMLVRQVRLLLAAQRGVPQGVPPYVAQGLVRRAKQLPRAALRASLADLQRCDAALKESQLPPALILERAIWPLGMATER